MTKNMPNLTAADFLGRAQADETKTDDIFPSRTNDA